MNYATNFNDHYKNAVESNYWYSVAKQSKQQRHETNARHLNSNSNSNGIQLKIDKQKQWVGFDEVIRLEAESSYTKVFVQHNTQPVLVCKPLKYFDDKLNMQNFIRTHRSHLVNKRFVQSFNRFNKPKLLLSDGSTVEVSHRRLKGVKVFFHT